MKRLLYKNTKLDIKGTYYAAEKADYMTAGSPHIFEIELIEVNNEDVTDLLDNDLEEIEELILNKYYN